MKKRLSGFDLKLIACAAMLIDHTAYLLQVLRVEGFLWEESVPYYLMRVIGRIAFPIFAFLLVEGFYHTKNVRNYALRLLVGACVSELFFDYVFYGRYVSYYMIHQNVYFTLLLGLLMLWSINACTRKFADVPSTRNLLPWILLLGFCLLAEWMHTDYASMGILMIAGFYFFRGRPAFMGIYLALLSVLLSDSTLQYWAVLAVPFFYLYNGEKGKAVGRWFYAFYPAHLCVLAIVRFLWT